MERQKSTRNSSRKASATEAKKIGRGKRRRGSDFDSSDDDDDDDEYENDRRDQKNERDVIGSTGSTGIRNKQGVESESKRLAGKYRDRAKERQDGTFNEYNADVVLRIDRNLDDKMFDNVVAAVESGDRQRLQAIATSSTSTTVTGTIPVTPKDALNWIRNTQNAAQTSLGKGVLEYLRRKNSNGSNEPIEVSAAGRNVQQSIMTFSGEINTDPRDRQRSWERPSEQMFATSTITQGTTRQRDNVILKASLICNLDLLQKIQSTFDKRDRRMERIEKEKSDSVKKVNGSKIDFGEKDEAEADDDDDDDIFATVGEYNADDDEADVKVADKSE